VEPTPSPVPPVNQDEPLPPGDPTAEPPPPQSTPFDTRDATQSPEPARKPQLEESEQQ
jgi:hypothetical protein